MTAFPRALPLLLAMLPFTAAHAADATEAITQEKNACEQQEQQKGTGEKASSVVCAIKIMFQSRIRRRKDTEPVEMTVGSPPMQSEDTETPGPNNWEINFAMQADFAGRERRIEFPVFDINYGKGDRWQFTYEIPYVFQTKLEPNALGRDQQVHANGVGDSTLGIKYRFYDNEDNGLSFAIYPQFEVRTPGANRDVSEGHTILVLPLIMTKEFEHASISANVGVEAGAGERSYFASLGVGWRTNANIALMAEIAGTDLNVPEQKRFLLNFGIRRKISTTQSITAAVGRDIYAGGEERKHNHLTLAYQKLFGD